MLSFKKFTAAVFCLAAVIFSTSTASAMMEYGVDITISDLGDFNLAGFDIDVSYDDTSLTFIDYTLTEELGSFDTFDADDWSFGDDGSGTVNLNVLSSIAQDDEFFATQANDFTLATLTFDGDATALAGISLSYILFSDEFGDPIPFTVDGTNINVVPVPSTVGLMSIGLLSLTGIIRRKRN